MHQLALPFAQTADYSRENFCAAPSNEMARDWLARPDAWSQRRLVLYGPAGCGKTHLLHIWARERHARILRGPELTGLVRPDRPVALDEADRVAEPEALLHLLNGAAEAGLPVLMTARRPPAAQDIALPDLASRLCASLSVQIHPPEDALLDMFLLRLAAARQLELPAPLRRYLITHLPRTLAAMQEAVARLDEAALAEKKKPSRQLAAALLGGFAGDTDSSH